MILNKLFKAIENNEFDKDVILVDISADGIFKIFEFLVEKEKLDIRV